MRTNHSTRTINSQDVSRYGQGSLTEYVAVGFDSYDLGTVLAKNLKEAQKVLKSRYGHQVAYVEKYVA